MGVYRRTVSRSSTRAWATQRRRAIRFTSPPNGPGWATRMVLAFEKVFVRGRITAPNPLFGRNLSIRYTLEARGALALVHWGNRFETRTPLLYIAAVFSCSVGVLMVLVPATFQNSSGTPIVLPSWLTATSVTFCLSGLTILAATFLIRHCWHVVTSPTFIRVVGFHTTGVQNLRPDLILSEDIYGVFARHWFRRQQLSLTAEDTYLQMLADWEGSAGELLAAAISFEK